MAIYVDCSKSENGIRLVEGTEGKVLFLREKNGYHDSDFYATYWCVDTKKPITIEYATTRAYSRGQAYVDATDDILAEYNAYKDEKEKIAQKWREEYDITKKLLEIVKGSSVSIIRGRKYKGITGIVIWIGKCGFTNKTKYGVAISDKKDSKGFYVDVVWVLSEYCQKDIPNYDDIKRRYDEAYHNSGVAFADTINSVYSRR
jgi:hypothetical protein